MGLIDTTKLSYDNRRSGQKGTRSGVGHPLVTPRSGGGRGPENAASTEDEKASTAIDESEPENALLERVSLNGSYRRHGADAEELAVPAVD